MLTAESDGDDADGSTAWRPLPTGLAPLIDRRSELEHAVELLGGGARLVTLTGTGGVGKTRLAVAVAEAAPSFASRVLYVSLAPVRDPDLVLQAIAAAAGIEAGADGAIADVVAGVLDRRSLVVLDNFEQVVDAAPEVAALIERCAELHVLVTSRVPLDVPGEMLVPVEPLPAAASVDLLVQEVNRFDPAFAIDSGNEAAVDEICRRVDGLPLAIELAAARLQLLAPAELVDLLGRRLDVLRSGRRGRQAHHQTLRATVDWSYRLLGADVRRTLRAVGVFVGGFTLDAAARVTGLGPYVVLDHLDALVAHHLVRPEPVDGAVRRFGLLDTIRDFALEELATEGEETTLRDRHLAWAATLAEECAAELIGPNQVSALRRLDADIENIRAALGHAGGTPSSHTGLRLASAMWRYWWTRGDVTAGRRWLSHLIDRYDRPPDASLAAALQAAAALAEEQFDSVAADALLQRALAIVTELGDQLAIADTLQAMAISVRSLGDLETSESLHLKALAVFREHGETRRVAAALNGLATVAYLRGDLAAAAAGWQESVDAVRTLDDRRGLGSMLGNLGMALLRQGDVHEAIAIDEESLAIARELDDRAGVARALSNLGSALIDADLDRAVATLGEALTLLRELGDHAGEGATLHGLGRCERRRGDVAAAGAHFTRSAAVFASSSYGPGIASALEGLGVTAVSAGLVDAAAAVLAKAAAIRAHGGTVPEDDGVDVERATTIVARRLGPERLAERTAQAAAWSTTDAVEAAAELADELRTATVAAPVRDAVADAFGLSAREREIVGHLARRRTDQEIAADLYISVRTVTTHVSAILRKLGVASRRDVAALVERLGLA